MCLIFCTSATAFPHFLFCFRYHSSPFPQSIFRTDDTWNETSIPGTLQLRSRIKQVRGRQSRGRISAGLLQPASKCLPGINDAWKFVAALSLPSLGSAQSFVHRAAEYGAGDRLTCNSATLGQELRYVNVILDSIWAEGMSQPPASSSRFMGLFVLLSPVFRFLSRVCFCFSSLRCAPSSQVALITQAFRSLFIEKKNVFNFELKQLQRQSPQGLR